MAKKSEIGKTELVIVNSAQVQQMIHVIRGERVILDRDLAQLYGVETKNLKRQVKRNASRFPSDFMIELSREEYNSLRCQNGTIENGRGEHSKYLPYAFTESGVAMLSSVLTSEVAVQVNIQIMRAFTMLRQTFYAIKDTTIRQDHLELEVEKLKNYVEDVLRDQNDTNEIVGAQMAAINESLAELAVKVDSLTQKKREPLPAVGFAATAARYEEEAKKKTNK
ncbi:MAG: ORF6N domain-containing protein [Paludibacteraceae bacterium]|nr:ORF6N domain-containing protein [Paludibacteraceae bacterium]